MKVKVLKDGQYAIRGSAYKDIYLDAGTEFITTDYELICRHTQYYVSYKGETVILYDDEVEVTPDEVTEKIAAMRKAKLDSLNKQKRAMEEVPSVNDVVLFTRSAKDGLVLGDGRGVVVDLTYVTAFHVWMKVREEGSNKTHELILGHPQGWYGGDSVQIESTVNRSGEFTYYGIHDEREDKLRLDSLYVYREDTENYLRSLVGEPVPPYMKVRKLKVQFDD